jgi:hypothetical protein
MPGRCRRPPIVRFERRRLAGVIAGLLAGAAAGALLLVHARPYAAGLPLVVSAVVIATARIAFGTAQPM